MPSPRRAVGCGGAGESLGCSRLRAAPWHWRPCGGLLPCTAQGQEESPPAPRLYGTPRRELEPWPGPACPPVPVPRRGAEQEGAGTAVSVGTRPQLCPRQGGSSLDFLTLLGPRAENQPRESKLPNLKGKGPRQPAGRCHQGLLWLPNGQEPRPCWQRVDTSFSLEPGESPSSG